MKMSNIAKLPTLRGDFKIQAFIGENGEEHIVIYTGDISGKENVPIRIHSECLTSEVLGSLKCDCREQLNYALQYIQDEGFGAVIYMRQEGRGIGLFHKVDAYALQDEGYDTIQANVKLGLPVDSRKYDEAVKVINHFNLRSIRLLTNNPLKSDGLLAFGVKITDCVPIKIPSNPYNQGYLATKKIKMNHTF